MTTRITVNVTPETLVERNRRDGGANRLRFAESEAQKTLEDRVRQRRDVVAAGGEPAPTGSAVLITTPSPEYTAPQPLVSAVPSVGTPSPKASTSPRDPRVPIPRFVGKPGAWRRSSIGGILLVPTAGPINADGNLRGKSTIRGANLFVKNYIPDQVEYRPPVFAASGGPDNQPYVEAFGQLIEDDFTTRIYSNGYFASAFIAGNGAYTAYVPSDGNWGEWGYFRASQTGNLDGQPFSLVDKRKYDEFTLEAWMRNAQPGVEMGNIFSFSTVNMSLVFKDAFASNPNYLRAFVGFSRLGPGYYGNVVSQNWFQLRIGSTYGDEAFVEHFERGPTARPLGEWRHFALVKSRTSCDFFLDGQPLVLTDAYGSIQDSWNRFGPVVGTLSLEFSNNALPITYFDPALGKLMYEPLAPPSPSAIHGLRFTAKALYRGPFTPPTSITTLSR